MYLKLLLLFLEKHLVSPTTSTLNTTLGYPIENSPLADIFYNGIKQQITNKILTMKNF